MEQPTEGHVMPNIGPRFDPTMPPPRMEGDHSFCGCESVEAPGAGVMIRTEGCYDRFRCVSCRREWLALTPDNGDYGA
jgi:hypothetical protein